MSRPQNWKEVIDTANLSSDKEMDVVSKWLIITRAAVFTMTATSALIGGLLAAAVAENPDWLNFALAFFGLIIAHAANNMNNDYFDMEGGVEHGRLCPGSVCAAPGARRIGLEEEARHGGIPWRNALNLAILIVLIARAGWPTLVFALAGLFISFFYVAPPLKLKHHGFGEPGVFSGMGTVHDWRSLLCDGRVHAHCRSVAGDHSVRDRCDHGLDGQTQSTSSTQTNKKAFTPCP